LFLDLFKKVGREIKELSDYSWMAPNNSMSCWEKAHSFYIPKRLFLAGTSHQLNQEWSSSNDKMKFVNAALSSDCYLIGEEGRDTKCMNSSNDYSRIRKFVN
jgi:hypothetical protein